MKFLRKFGFGLSALIFGSAVGGLITLATLNHTLLQPPVVKQWLSDGKIYNNFIEQALKANEPQLQESLQGNVLINPQSITQAMQAAFTPKYLQNKTEYVIDQGYKWLNQETPVFTFEVKPGEQQAVFEQNLSAHIAQKLSVMKVCPANRQQTLDDATSGRCMPHGITVAELSNTMARQTANGIDVFKQNFKVPGDKPAPIGQEPSPYIQYIPHGVWWVNLLLIILWPIMLLGGLGILLLARTKRVGLRTLGWRLVLSSVFLTIAGALLTIYAPQFSVGNLGVLQMGEGAQAGTISLVEPILRLAAADIGKYFLIFSSPVLALGVSLLLILLFNRPRPATVQAPPEPIELRPTGNTNNEQDLPPPAAPPS